MPLYRLFYPLSFGWLGVCLFFVLSGFCIHSSYLRSARFSLSIFYVRRFWRIYVPYAVALVGFIIINRVYLAETTSLRQLATHLLMAYNFDPETLIGVN